MANMAVVSVAGAYAAREAREALATGMHVLLFSDNVTVEDEIALKRFAVDEGLLMMGPGAGTAILNGVGLGFANAVPRGPVGIISAAGTGLQEVSCLLAKGGVGVSQAIGTGGRDLSAQVGGLMAMAALEALIEDKSTELIILISKPADTAVTANLVDRLRDGKKPGVVCTLGAQIQKIQVGEIHFTRTLEECAQTALRLLDKDVSDYKTYLKASSQDLLKLAKKLRKKLSGGQKYLRGLFSGGTLCYEAQVIWNDLLAKPVYSNAPFDKEFKLPAGEGHPFHTAIDMGEEEYTVGRPHPMIDNDLRTRFILSAGQDPAAAVIVLDVVLGFGVHPDRGGELAGAVMQARKAAKDAGRTLHVVASITGTDGDPQSLNGTEEILEKAGVVICNSNAQAARLAGFIVSENTEELEKA
jgi:succinyl-CoA synthetase alpha subunit